jgi:hypothetical protein
VDSLLAQSSLIHVYLEMNDQYLNDDVVSSGCSEMDRLTAKMTVSVVHHVCLCGVVILELDN